MLLLKRTVLLLVAAAALSACGGHPVRQVNPLHVLHNMMSRHLLTVNVGAQNGSGQWGSASASNKSHGVIVTVSVHGEPRGAKERAYLANGNCSRPSSAAWRSLHPVQNGNSKTFIPRFGVGSIRAHTHSVVVQGKNGRFVACGDFQT